MDIFIAGVWILVWAVAFGVVGAFLGDRFRGSGTAGFWLGFLFGPLGYLGIVALQDTRRRCRACTSTLPSGVVRACPRCGTSFGKSKQPAQWPPPPEMLDDIEPPPIQREGALKDDDVLSWLGSPKSR
jgi:hypothetical protein